MQTTTATTTTTITVVTCMFLSETVYTATQCEGGMSEMTLSCPGSRRLLIRSAMFARQDSNTKCPHPTATAANDCTSQQAMDVVQTLCDGWCLCVRTLSSSAARVGLQLPCEFTISCTRAQQLLRWPTVWLQWTWAEKWGGGCCAHFRGRAGSPSSTRPTSVPSGIMIHPTIWPQ